MAVTAEGKNAAKEYLNSVGKSVSKPGSPVRPAKFSSETITIPKAQTKAPKTTQIKEEEEEPSFFKWLGDNVQAGLNQFNRNLVSTYDFILGRPIDYVYHLATGKMDEYNPSNVKHTELLRNIYDNQIKATEESESKMGKGYQIAGQLFRSTVAAAPDAILAMLTGGGSKAASLASAGAKATSGTSKLTGTVKKIADKATELAKNPSFLSSLVQMAGPTYESAKEEGASDLQAMAATLVSSVLNAGVEVSGGIQNFPKNTKGVIEWAKSATEEGIEEVVQGINENAIKQITYDHDRPVLSTTDENAVFNPVRVGEEFAGGAVVGGVLGGVQTGLSRIAQAKSFADVGKQYRSNADDVIQAGSEYGKNTQTYKTSQELAKKVLDGKEISDTELGKYVTNAILEADKARIVSSQEDSVLTSLEDTLIDKGFTQSMRKEMLDKAINLYDTANSVGADAKSAIALSSNLAQDISQDWKNNKAKNFSELDISKYSIDFLSDPNGVIDEKFIDEYAEEFSSALIRSNSRAFSRLTDGMSDPAEYLKSYIRGEEQTNAVGETFKRTLQDTVSKSANAKMLLYGDNPTLSAQAEAIRNGDFSVVAMSSEATAEPRNAGATAENTSNAASNASNANNNVNSYTSNETPSGTQNTPYNANVEQQNTSAAQQNVNADIQNRTSADIQTNINAPVETSEAVAEPINAAATAAPAMTNTTVAADTSTAINSTSVREQNMSAAPQTNVNVPQQTNNMSDTKVVQRTAVNNSTDAGISTPQSRTVDISDVSNVQQNSNANSVDSTSSARPKSNVSEMVTRIHSSYDPTVSKRETTRAINDIYSTLQKGFDTNATAEQQDAYIKEASNKALELGRNIVDNSRITEAVSNNEGYDELKKELRTTSISISDEDKSDINGSGGFNEFRKKYFGKLRISNNGVPVDTYYSELSASYPELFPSDITHPGDRLQRIAEVQDMLYSEPKRREMSSEEYNESVLDIAATIVSEAGQYIDLPVDAAWQNTEAAGGQNTGTLTARTNTRGETTAAGRRTASEAEIAAENGTQVINDYGRAVEDIMTVDDETVRRLADNRTVVKISDSTPDVILDNVSDAEDLPVIINYNKLYLAVRDKGVFKGHYHNLGADISKKLPDFLSAPDAIIRLKNGRLNMLATVATSRGNNAVISVELNSTKDIGGRNKNYNVVVTLFSADNNYVENLVSKEGVTVPYQKEDLSQVNPQLYKWLATINDKSSSIDNSISQDSAVVNRNNMQETENYSDGNRENALRTRNNNDTIEDTDRARSKGADDRQSLSEESQKSQAVADYVKDKLAKGEKITANELFAVTSRELGGRMADGTITSKDAYDAMELGVNQYILDMDKVDVQSMLDLMDKLPTQTKRTEGMDRYQQFSTPPSLAYLADYAANVNSNDIMLEPSAGIGGIAVFAKRDGAEVHVNELDKRRLEVLKNMPFDAFYNEDAEQINNILGDELQPTVVVMNPPFSSSASRNMKNIRIGAKHVEEALKMLAPNGRLVAVTGRGMADGAPAFRNWWDDIKSKYNVVANFSIDGKNYNKYGTNFDVQMIVIDNNGPTTSTETGTFDDLIDLEQRLGEIRNGREEIPRERNNARNADGRNSEQSGTVPAREDAVGESSGNTGRQDAVPVAGGVDDTGNTDNGQQEGEQKPKRQNRRAVGRTAGRTDDSVVGSEHDGGRVLQGRESRSGEQSNSNENAGGNAGADSGNAADVSSGLQLKKKKRAKKLTDSVYEEYIPHKLLLKGAKAHPAKISESVAMSAIEPPAVTYKPDLPQDIIDRGVLSNVQLEAITYAGQSHAQSLPNGETRGFFLGDGTGVGKGRTITGIILDNFRHGRKKALWLSLNGSLANDAKRDVSALFGDSSSVLQYEGGKKSEKSLGKDEGILFATYSALAKGFENDGSNFKKIVNWLGKDFDGVIVFDEAHKMGNASGQKGKRGTKKASQTGLAGIELQKALPKAKIVYSSATGATEVSNLRYAERLGLWGEGTAFKNGDDFVSQITSGGIAAMELVARDMKAMGVYLSRNISYEDVTYERVEHKLTAEQKKIYNTVAKAWQIVFNNMNKALEATNQDKDGTARGSAMSAFWGGEQRFFNQLLTTMQVPSVIQDIEKQLADGKSVVIQLVTTNEAALNEDLGRVQNEGLGLEDLDITPKRILMNFVEKSFPVEQYETYKDDDGNTRSRKVLNSRGEPVLNRDAVKAREKLLDELGSIKVPSSPIDMIIDHFGVDMVAESTGRTRRVVTRNGKKVLENISNKRDADVDAFQNGDKRIIIFSKAGGTGKSYHADRSAKNQQQRVHYLLEAGWKADDAVQGFGRSHRSNQASAPIFKLVTTNLSGQKRFISTIAKRLGQLGALTKGQSQTGGQGMFTAADNLENEIAADTLAGYYKALSLGTVDGIKDGMSVIEKMGMKNSLFDENGNFDFKSEDARDVSKFLNRILSLEFTEQNAVFDGYAKALQAETEIAAQEGTLDRGLENYKADKVTLNEEQDISVDDLSGAVTKYYNLTAENRIKPTKYSSISTKDKNFVGFVTNKRTGAIRAAFKTSTVTDATGAVYNNYRLVGPASTEYVRQDRFMRNWSKAEDPEASWNKAVDELPEYKKEPLHLIGGAVLPVWGKLPKENTRIYRVLTDDGDMIIGRVIPSGKIDETLRRMGTKRNAEKIDISDVVKRIKAGDTVYLDNGWKIVKRRVSNENRIEIIGPSFADTDSLKNKGVFTERISYTTRYFVPYDNGTETVIRKITDTYPIQYTEASESYSRTSARSEQAGGAERWQTTKDTRTDAPSKEYGKLRSIDDVRKYLSESFNVPISSGKVTSRSAAGVFKTTPEAIRTRIANDLPTAAHEIGHYLDKKYSLSKSDNINDAIAAMDSDFAEQYKKSELPGEAVAEFVRRYLRNRSDAQSSAPAFYDEFISTLSKADMDVMNTAARWINGYMSQGFSRRVDANIVTRKEASKTTAGEKISKAKKKLLTDIVDSFLPIRDATEYVKKVKGSSMQGEKNAYMIATNSRNASAVADYILKTGMTDLDGNIGGGKSFIEAIKDVDGKQLNTFSRYLVLKHALEWIEPKKGAKAKRVFADETLQDADSIRKEIAKIEKSYPKFKTAADNVYEYQRNIITNFAVRSGAIDRDTANKLFEMYPCYVPFYRSTGGQKRGQKYTFANQKVPIMRAKGSGAAILNPLESIVQNTDRFVKFAMRNRVMQTLADYAENVDGFGQLMERVPPDMVPKTIQMGDYKAKIQKALEQGGKLTGENIFEVTNALDEILGEELTGYTPIANAKKKLVSVVRNGKNEYYQIHDPDLYTAVAELTPQQMGAAFRLSRQIMTPMKLLITSFNPVFATSNPIRDIDTAFKNSVVTNPAEFVKNYVAAVKDIVTNSDAYKEYKAAGGGHPSELSANIDTIRRSLRDIAAKDMGVARRVAYALFVHPVDTVSKLNDITETIPRLAEFKAIKKRGGDTQSAIYAADDITTNFKRVGSGGRKIDAALMFNNAAVQGLSKLYRSFRDASPAERLQRVGKYLAEGVILTVVMALFNRRDDEAEKAYNNLSQYMKNNNYVFYIGSGEFIKIPKAREMALLNTVLERTTDAMLGDKDAFYQFGDYLVETILPPMIPMGEDPIDAVHGMLNETVIGGITDVGFNRNYMGVPIESARYEYLPRNQRYSATTSKAAVALGNSWVGQVTNLSPLQIDHIISSYTGYLGQMNEALFPMDSSKADYGMGFKNKFVADSLYSEDTTDMAYEARDEAKDNYDMDPTPVNAIKYEKQAIKTSYISRMQAAINALPAKQQRAGRELLLDELDDWTTRMTATDKKIIDDLGEYSSTDIKYYMSELPESKLESTSDGVKYTYQMTPAEYTEYVEDVMGAVETGRSLVAQARGLTPEIRAERIKKAISDAKSAVKKRYVSKYRDKMKASGE